jgi:hypothetical protein
MKKSIFLYLLILSSTILVAKDLPGLWLANVEVIAVNEIHKDAKDVTKTTPVKYPFNLQLLLHMDASGNTKLLKEVFVMQTKDDNTNDNIITRVLITDTNRFKDFEGIIKRGDNKLVGVRLTTPSFDFDTSKRFWPLTGSIAQGATITGTNISHSKSHPTNPFRHQFHPEHKYGFDLNRTFNIKIENKDIKPTQINKQLTGTYTETIKGLHKSTLKVSGTVNMSLISSISILNPSK